MALAQTSAAEDRSDSAVWTTLSTRGQLTTTGSWRWIADTLARSREGVNALDFLFQSVMVTHGVGEHAALGFGYAFGAGFLEAGTLLEHRFAQHLTLTYGRRTRVYLRHALEERFISGRDAVLLRTRTQAKVAFPLVSRGRLTGIISDEVLVRADARRGATPVLDGNRLLVGVERRVTPRVAMDVGYMNVLIRAGSYTGRRSHVLALSLVTTRQGRPQ